MLTLSRAVMSCATTVVCYECCVVTVVCCVAVLCCLLFKENMIPSLRMRRTNLEINALVLVLMSVHGGWETSLIPLARAILA